MLAHSSRQPNRNLGKTETGFAFLFRFINEEVGKLLARETTVLLCVKALLNRERQLRSHLRVAGRINRGLPEQTRILVWHARYIALTIVQCLSDTLHLGFRIPGILQHFACFLIKARAHKAIHNETGRARHLMRSGELLGLGLHILPDGVFVSNRVLIHLRMAHLDKQPKTAGQIRVMGVMEVVRLTALNQAHCFAQVMRHARLHRNNVGVGVLDLQ